MMKEKLQGLAGWHGLVWLLHLKIITSHELPVAKSLSQGKWIMAALLMG
jgi:hypothetical protein